MLVAIAGLASATACTSGSFLTLADLQTAISCTDTYTDFTLTFSNFNISGDAASNVNEAANFVNSLGFGGFQLTDASGAFPNNPVVISFQVAISGCAGGFTCAVTGYSDQMFLLNDTGGTVSVVYNPVPGPSGSNPGGSPQVLTYSSSEGQGQTDIQPNSINAAGASAAGTYNGVGSLNYFQSDFFGTATPAGVVPEPASLFLLGGGLLAFGAVRRRAVKR
jgi:hypothetical protein